MLPDGSGEALLLICFTTSTSWVLVSALPQVINVIFPHEKKVETVAQESLLDNEQNAGPIPLRDPCYLLPSMEPCLTALVLEEGWNSRNKPCLDSKVTELVNWDQAFPEDSVPLQRER